MGCIMRSEVYDAVSDHCWRLVCSQDELKQSSTIQGAEYDAALSVYLAAQARWVRKTAWKHKLEKVIAKYVAAYHRGMPIWQIAKNPKLTGIDEFSGSNDVGPIGHYSPYLLARILLERLQPGCRRDDLGTLVSQPHLISDPRLRSEVLTCCNMDRYASPFMDRVRMYVGDEHEYRLERLLSSRGLAFWSEDETRAQGHAKTPDIRLARPIAIPCPHRARRAEYLARQEAATGSDSGPTFASIAAGNGAGTSVSRACTAVDHDHLVCWIDSKAVFADPFTHGENSEQLSSYVSLFGPGLCIYWFGLVESLCPCIDGGDGATAAAAKLQLQPPGGGRKQPPAAASATSAPASTTAGASSQQQQPKGGNKGGSKSKAASDGRTLVTHPDPAILLATALPAQWRYCSDAEVTMIQGGLAARQLLAATAAASTEAGAAVGASPSAGAGADVDIDDGAAPSVGLAAALALTASSSSSMPSQRPFGPVTSATTSSPPAATSSGIVQNPLIDGNPAQPTSLRRSLGSVLGHKRPR